MQGAPRLPLGVVTIVLLIAPGLVGLEAYYRLSRKRRTDLSRTRLLIYSTVLSLFSLGLLYVLSPFYFAELTSALQGLVTGSNLVTGDRLTDTSLSESVALYSTHTLVSVVVGVGLGLLSDKVLNRERRQDPRDPWSYAFEERVGNESDIVAKLTSGQTIVGSYLREAWDPERRELYLDNPRSLSEVIDPDDFDDSMTAKRGPGSPDWAEDNPRGNHDEVLYEKTIDNLAGGVVLTADTIESIYFTESSLRGGLDTEEPDAEVAGQTDGSGVIIKRARKLSATLRIYVLLYKNIASAALYVGFPSSSKSDSEPNQRSAGTVSEDELDVDDRER